MNAQISTKGREISRPPYGNLLFPAAVMASSIRGFAGLAGSSGQQRNRSAELLAFANRIAPLSTTTRRHSSRFPNAMASSPSSVPLPFLGGRHFWKADYSTYHAPNFFSSLKMFSTRMSNNEICNHENLKADHTADGALYTYQDGQEYHCRCMPRL
jgi:hypothetical protein